MPINRNQCQSRVRTPITDRIVQCRLEPHEEGTAHRAGFMRWNWRNRYEVHPATCSLGPKHS